ncbi:MAG: sigma-70 family RNA polymerase sigma factor, partial [Planctomycetota bacterium]
MITSSKKMTSPLEQIRRKQRSVVRSSGLSSRRFSEREQRLINSLLEKEQDYIDSPDFHVEGAEESIYGVGDDIRKPDVSWYQPLMDDLTPTKNRQPASGEQVLLTGAQEKILFHKFNYARFRIRELQIAIAQNDDRQPNDEQASELLRWHGVSSKLREQIANTNLALVLAMAKRTRMSEVDFADLISEGNMALLRAVDKFDAGRGFKFSTYACRAILKAFSRQGMKLSKYRQRFPTDFDPKLEKSDFVESRREEYVQDAASEVKRIVEANRAELSNIEQTVIEYRFGIEQPIEGKPMTLEQIG